MLAFQARHALGMVVADLLDALRLRELDQRFPLAPGEGGTVLDSIFFVKLCVVIGIGMLFHQPHPFDLLLEKAKGAAAA